MSNSLNQSLTSEAGPTQEFEQLKLSSQLCFPLYACARKVINYYTPYLKTFGLTYTQYIVFMVLWEHDNIRVGELCRTLYLDSGTLTPLLKKMEETGYIIRTRSTEDERVVQVKLTEKGSALKYRMADVPAQVSSCVHLDPGEAVTLYRTLYRILDQ